MYRTQDVSCTAHKALRADTVGLLHAHMQGSARRPRLLYFLDLLFGLTFWTYFVNLMIIIRRIDSKLILP